MKIQLNDKYWLLSNSNCFSLAKERVVKGESEIVSFMYYTSLTRLFRRLTDLLIMESSATSLEELHDDIVKINEFIESKIKLLCNNCIGGGESVFERFDGKIRPQVCLHYGTSSTSSDKGDTV